MSSDGFDVIARVNSGQLAIVGKRTFHLGKSTSKGQPVVWIWGLS